MICSEPPARAAARRLSAARAVRARGQGGRGREPGGGGRGRQLQAAVGGAFRRALGCADCQRHLPQQRVRLSHSEALLVCLAAILKSGR